MSNITQQWETLANDPLLSVPQIARFAGVTTVTVRRWIRERRLRGVQINKRWRIRQSQVLAMLKGESNGKSV